jgi:hypothetical protein
MRLAILSLTLICAVSVSAQKLEVKIIDRQDNETEYTYVIPAHFSSQGNSNLDCNTFGDNTNCSGTTTTTGTSTPAHQVSYHVRGATFTLLLPDGRGAIVNCENKFAEHMAGPAGNHRSCRVPLVDNITVEFKGDKAKLKWVVSLDGKKIQSETYKVLAVLNKR